MKKRFFRIGLVLLVVLIVCFIFIPRTVTVLIGIEDSDYDSLRIELRLDEEVIFDQYVLRGHMDYEKVQFKTTLGRHKFSLKAFGSEMLLDTTNFILFNDNLWVQGVSDTTDGDGFLFDNLGLSDYYFD